MLDLEAVGLDSTWLSYSPGKKDTNVWRRRFASVMHSYHISCADDANRRAQRIFMEIAHLGEFWELRGFSFDTFDGREKRKI